MRPKEIKIYPVLNGYIVQVGCQSVVFETLAKMTAEITRYYTSPDLIVTDYVKNAVNRLIDLKSVQAEDQGLISVDPRSAPIGWGADRVSYSPPATSNAENEPIRTIR